MKTRITAKAQSFKGEPSRIPRPHAAGHGSFLLRMAAPSRFFLKVLESSVLILFSLQSLQAQVETADSLRGVLDEAIATESNADTTTSPLQPDSAPTAPIAGHPKTLSAARLSHLIKLHEARGDFENAFRRMEELIALKDTLLRDQNLKQVNDLKMRFEAERKEKQIAALETDRKIKELEIRESQLELDRRRLSLIAQSRWTKIIKRDAEIGTLELQRNRSKAEAHSNKIAEIRIEAKKHKHELELKEADIHRKRMLTDSLLVFLLLTVAVAGLAVKSLRDKRRTATLAAEAAENRALAMETEALEQRIEIDRREKEAGKLFSRRLISMQEQERKRIAGSLHDGIGQDLLIIKHRAMMALDDEPSAREQIGEILEISTEALDDVIRLSGDIRPVQLERQGLASTLRSTVASVSDSARLDIDVNIEDVDGVVAPAQEIDIYRIVQEGINNIVRHSGASRASVTVKRVDGTLLLKIDDNGRGFVDRDDNSGVMQSGFGLQAMKERVRVLHGIFEVGGGSGKGAHIRISIPVMRREEAVA